MVRITQGEPIVLSITVSLDGAPQTLSGWDVRAAIRRNADAGSALLQGQVAVANNVATVSFVDTSTLAPGNYVVSVRFDQPAGIKRTLNYNLIVRNDDVW